MDNPIPNDYAAKSLRQAVMSVFIMVLAYGSILMVLYGCIQLLKKAFS